VARVCHEQLRGLGLDFEALAIHRLVEEESRTFETYEIQPSKEAARWVKPHPHLHDTWQGGRTVYHRDLEVDPEGLIPEKLNRLSQRYEMSVRCILDVPHIRGTIALLSAHPDAFSESEVSFIELIARVVSIGISRVEDLEQVEASRRQLRSLAFDLVSAQEEERRRIATGMHDRIAQVLSASKMMLETMRASASSSGLAGSLETVLRLVDQSIQEIRALTFELSPPVLHELGLEAALEWLAEEFQRRHGLRVTFEDDGERKPLETPVRDLLFRAVQELLANVIQHAHAYSARVSARREGEEIRIEMEDNGAGIDISPEDLPVGRGEGFGLFNIRERLTHIGGHFEFHSELGRGTRVVLTAPLKRA
jgi:signal transduction histidine kinase